MTDEEKEALENGGYFRGCYNMSADHRDKVSEIFCDFARGCLDLSTAGEDLWNDVLLQEYRPKLISDSEETETLAVLEEWKNQRRFGNYLDEEVLLSNILKALGMKRRKRR